MTHSSLQPSPHLRDVLSETIRFYHLPLWEKSRIDPRKALELGWIEAKNRNFESIENSIYKAKCSRIPSVLVPFDRMDSVYTAMVQYTQSHSMGLILQVPFSVLNLDQVNWLLNQARSIEVDILFDENPSESAGEKKEWIRQLQNVCKVTFHIFVDKGTDWSVFKKTGWLDLSSVWHLYFPYESETHSLNLSVQEIARMMKLLKIKCPDKVFLPPRGIDLWDTRALADLNMEPFFEPCFQTQSQNPAICYSVIIPTYNNQNHLRVVLRHLYQQSIGLDQFEVIVVDDGSSDQTQEKVQTWLSTLPTPFNFKYVFSPRTRERKMGDGQYRAGISRHLGVKNAVGDIFCFLDSDIVVPKSYLSDVGQCLQTFDGIQAKRINLSQAASHLQMNIDQLQSDQDLIPDEPYWQEFLQEKAWHQRPYNWKYVCTHSFSVKKSTYWDIGGLKRNYIFYGFEDTDLGYRLVKNGYRLHLLDREVYHLYHEDQRSEFANLHYLRHQLLTRTAQIFYRHHLDPDIFENLRGFMKSQAPWAVRAKHWFWPSRAMSSLAAL